MFRTLLLSVSAAGLLAGCMTTPDYARPGTRGDYYYGRPTTEYRYYHDYRYGYPQYGPYGYRPYWYGPYPYRYYDHRHRPHPRPIPHVPANPPPREGGQRGDRPPPWRDLNRLLPQERREAAPPPRTQRLPSPEPRALPRAPVSRPAPEPRRARSPLENVIRQQGSDRR